MIPDLSREKKKVVGTKQTLKSINSGLAAKVYVAVDIDEKIKKEILQASREKNVSVETVESKLTLGRACGIEVSAACAALLK